ncbi:F0F1 ATP synthase subunit delta [Algicola sagamiensis]|uniref:F0F1 ATP synthase subunit delta n=1 Tax=Algicola sagamiensis TaxID=163869 RepID=UPI00037A3185|nr:F0F1 ATP synthase subunit delta [Algicola sagamiensis]
MSEMTTIARPYAKAAFEFAVEKGTVDEWAEMLFFAGEVTKNETMKSFLSGSASAENAAELFVKVCGEQLNEYGQNLVKIMAENGRLPAMSAVAELYAEFRAEYAKEMTVDVISATTLPEAQVEKIRTALEKRLARKVKLNCSVDINVVGGLVIKAGDTVIDGSLRGKLDRLSTALQS